MSQGKLRLNINKSFFSERVIILWHRMPREVEESPCSEMLKNHGDVALRDMVIEHGGGGLGLNLGIFEVFSTLTTP